jgi:cation-transporting ATPase E
VTSTHGDPATEDRTPDPADLEGLTDRQVAERVADGRVNTPPPDPGRTLPQIVRSNVLTPVNGIMLTLFALIMASGNWRDGLFVGVVVTNSLVGIVQEVRARRELAHLEVLSEPRATVIRDGERREIEVEEVVADDLLVLVPGTQIVVDGSVVHARGLEVDESLLTGESEPIDKAVGDEVLSGSFVAAGDGRFRAQRIGADSYATGLAAEARRFTLTNSELRTGINRILHWLIAIIPVASILLLLSLLAAQPRWQDAVQGTVAAAVAMVPDGLVLLTSIAFLAGIVAIARRRALAKRLSTVEVLARVDVLCLDKTGTITTGEIRLGAIEAVDAASEPEIREILAAVAGADPAPNATVRAVAAAAGSDPGWPVESTVAFSSRRKWSAVTFDRGTFIMGGPDVLLPADSPVLGRVGELSAAGRRILLLAEGRLSGDPAAAPTGVDPLALLVLEDTIRPDAPQILAYFREQDVELKVISGDDPQTVAAVAGRAGVEGSHRAVDARELPVESGALAEAIEANTVFGRVTPHQKQAMVLALQADGRTVAMTGDGVNDVLALKDADLGIAMGSGSSATKAVADLVLMDSSFSALPSIVDEGRKVINNVERVSNLFVTKAVYAVLLAVVIGLVRVPFPLLPRQLTLIGTFSIGVPGFFLALSPEKDLIRPGFLSRVLKYSIPAGLAAGAATLVVYEVARRSGSVSLDEARTASAVTLLGVGLIVLAVTSRPLEPWKLALVAGMALSYATIFAIEPLADFFELDFFAAWLWIVIGVAVAAAGVICIAVPLVVPGLSWSGRTGPDRT